MQRNIKTFYYVALPNQSHINLDPAFTNSSKDSNRAVAQCVYHMQINHYGARVAEVFDSESGELHAQVKRAINGNIEIVYKRDPAKFETRLALSALVHDAKKIQKG